MECLIPLDEIDDFFRNKDFYHIIIGPTNRGSVYHGVVGRKGKIVFDPYPDDSGLLYENPVRIGVFIYQGI